ncbi:hypothetical protein [Streptomyces sp. NBC_00878]|uniref:hypothetical protein n=1 Tax=Streptomyces sp. NBC_00878 TaxID=2975854 RepID=UPI00224D94F5|nr:hypothetical protein [Streptomyces sp. NBC_00878]MCX4911915.1 hypothetical protein [Streptomyces sp. NBC_00878]
MATAQNSKVRGKTRELLTALRDLLDTPGGEDHAIVRDRAVQAYSVLNALLTIEGAIPDTSIRILRDQVRRIEAAKTVRP